MAIEKKQKKRLETVKSRGWCVIENNCLTLITSSQTK
nr:MAG TPA: hypothetical protein [Caudoviricetes sp.]